MIFLFPGRVEWVRSSSAAGRLARRGRPRGRRRRLLRHPAEDSPGRRIARRGRADHELVTDGIFAHVRNPIYLAMALFLLALAVGLGHGENLLFAAPLFALGTWIRVREEERLLRARFG